MMNLHKSRCMAVGCLFVVVALCGSCGLSPGYNSFVHKEPAFFAQLAADCDRLLPQGPITETAETHKLARERNSLPPLVKALNPDAVLIDTNLVLLRIGSGQASFGVVWRQSDIDAHLWVLSAYTEGFRRELYTRRKATEHKEVPH
jgi:hypothetical protein